MICKQPRLLKGKGFKVPCRKCMPCRVNHAKLWRLRLEQEMEVCTSAHFLTLTYADENIVRNDSGNGVLIKKDLQDFFKRLRYYTDEAIKTETKALGFNQTLKIPSIRYYAVGEYGGETYRPHYHAIAYNIPLSVLQRIQQIWRFGFVTVGTVTPASIGYVTKYITKVDSRDIERMDLTKPFNVMSKGIGVSYVDDETREYHSREESLYTINKKHRIKIGAYLESKIHTTDEQKERVSEAKRKFAEEMTLKHIEALKNGETSYTKEKQRNEAREATIKLNNKRNKL